jgi:hypothetical protein
MGGHGLAWAGVGCHGLQRYPVARACFPRDNNRLGKHGPRLQSSLTYSAKLAPISLHAIHHLRLDVVPLRSASHSYRDAVPRSTAVPPRALAHDASRFRAHACRRPSPAESRPEPHLGSGAAI